MLFWLLSGHSLKMKSKFILQVADILHINLIMKWSKLKYLYIDKKIINNYFQGCQEEFVKQSFPDLLSWSDNNFTINREYVEEMFIERKDLCQQTSKLKKMKLRNDTTFQCNFESSFSSKDKQFLIGVISFLSSTLHDNPCSPSVWLEIGLQKSFSNVWQSRGSAASTKGPGQLLVNGTDLFNKKILSSNPQMKIIKNLFYLSSKVDFTNTFPHNEQPLIPKSCDHIFWIPIEKSDDWIFKDNSGNENIAQFLPWETGYPRGKSLCQ